MTTARRALTCPSCGFATDHQYHLLNCVPPSQWPRDFRERKMAAMHGSELDVMEIDGKRMYVPAPITPSVHEPEPEKPRGIAEYRRLHPEANPLTTEKITVREFRKREDGGTDEWDRVVGVKEAMHQAERCPRCNRPMLDRSMHITCQPVDGTIPPPEPRGRLVRDDVPLTPRHPVIHTQDEVRTGAAWYEALPEATEPDADEDEMRDFIGGVDEPTLAERLAAEQAAYVPGEQITEPIEIVEAGLRSTINPLPFTCPTCGRVSKSAAGNSAHQRAAHKPEA